MFPAQVTNDSLNLFFICVLGVVSFAAVSAAEAKQETSGQTPERQLVGETEDADFLSKEELLGEDYGTPPDLTEVKAQIHSHIEAIAGLCQYKTLAEQINQLINSLSALREIIPPNLDSGHLTIKDAVFLRRVYHSLAQEGILTHGEGGIEDISILKSFEEVPVYLADMFLDNLRRRYNLDEREGVDGWDPIWEENYNFEWEKAVYEGLTCV